MKMNELKQNLSEINRNWRVSSNPDIGYAPIKDVSGMKASGFSLMGSR